MQTANALVTRSRLALATAFLGLFWLLPVPMKAQTCANDPTRTIFAGGPGTEACQQFNDQDTCEKAFHRSGAGHLSPCLWNGSCSGNTAGFDLAESQTCEVLPDPQICIDATRTLKLTGGSNGFHSGTSVCQDLEDEDTCESAWHTTPKGVGIACCWQSNDNSCVGSAWGFARGECTHGNTCFASAARTGAPAATPWGLFGVATVLLVIGVLRIRAKRPSIWAVAAPQRRV